MSPLNATRLAPPAAPDSRRAVTVARRPDRGKIAVNGRPVPVRYSEDTTPVPPHGSFTMRIRFTDFTGRFVYHCHILNHEDGGMMGVVDVVS